MTSARFVRTLARHLALFQATAALLAEATLLGQPTTDLEATLLQTLATYAWAVRSRALLLLARTNPPALPSPNELHIRLSVIETLLATRLAHATAPVPPTEAPDQTPVTQPLFQRLATAESRLFHLFGIIPLN